MSSSRAQSALSWWEEAGVDTVVGETPRDWLNPKAKATPPEAAPTAAPPLPATLETFQAWLRESDALPFASPSTPRVGPSGDPASKLMVMIDMPSLADNETGALLSGEAGALFDRMMAAIQLARDCIYLASLSPIRTPTGSIDPESADRLAGIARHHIGLVKPEVLLLFGDICGRVLAGATVAGARGRWHDIETPAGPIKALVTIRPEKLMTQPALKAHAWADLQLLMEGLTP